MIEILLGQIPEALYFAIFMIFVKQLKTKRLVFILLMILEYVLLKYLIHYNMYFQIAYTFFTYIILKVLYKERSQITDIFTFTIGSIILIIISALCGMLYITNLLPYMVCLALNRLLMFGILFIFNSKLNKIQKLYKTMWNRNDKVKKKIKSTTFRSINVVVFNAIFYIINIGMIYAICFNAVK